MGEIDFTSSLKLEDMQLTWCKSPNILCEKPYNYQPQIKLLKLVHQSFWIQIYTLIMASMTLKFTGNQQKRKILIGHQKFLKGTHVIQYQEIYINIIAYPQILMKT